ncbi:hypothetical protein F511_28562 [Dorcoceras hygrometricum]|uniref:Uncharacterized protein n=1 Tax=Dorcoceras hygrometricum TaxID=472368 RepID=A0A2Z7AS48_9LAMI|nr:hypothetical protein F511_28562 [Dorcoceras hygrometricum]
MADARLPHLCAYKYQRTTTELLTPFRNSQSEKQHFFATKCCGNSSRFLDKVSAQATIQQVRDLGRIRAIDLLPDFVQIAGFVLPDFTPDSYTRLYQISDLLATERRGLVATKKELEETQVALEASYKVIAGLTEIGLSMSKKIEKMKVKKQQVRANHVECHQKFQARIHEAEDSMQAQHLIIEALVDEKDSLLQTIHGLQEANNAPAPFDGDWEEEPEEEPKEEEIEDIPLGEGEIDDE